MDTKQEGGFWKYFSAWLSRRSSLQLIAAGIGSGILWALTIFVIDPLPFLDEAVLSVAVFAIIKELSSRLFSSDKKE